MKKVVLNLFFLIIVSSLIYSQDDNYLINRMSFKLLLAVDDDKYYEWQVPESPFVLQNNTLQIYPGEKIFIELDFINDNLKSIQVVKKNVNPDRTIEISFNQEKDEKKHKFMILKVTNPFEKDLEYKAAIYLVLHKKWINTNIIPVKAGLSSYESWPDVISTIALFDFKLK